MSSQEAQVITLYDIPSRLPINAWSLNMWKSRFALNFKGLPHKTHWVEYPDIEQTMKGIGAAPTDKRDDGSDHYTCPVISDPTSGTAPAVVSDSWDIALYLDKAYPSAPLLFPKGTVILQEVYIQKLNQLVLSPVMRLLISFMPTHLNPHSAEYFTRTREEWVGKKIDDFCPAGPEREKALDQMKEGLGKLAGLLDKYDGGAERMFVSGEEPVFADFVLASTFEWAKIVGEEEVWSKVKSWHGGRWERFLNAVETQYGKVY
ncbi:hypothetical protein SISNIDRAFT_407213 [Sistotremastrum niveocremeum HHB9708]|uniref:Uncharacterized protein n=1 Tax=Sistotremastrum niveocremeum HHB9708 TaxID=1314777 RepID=A0A164Y287_9AGAM|nr:hypothetical protein SISNIDRAFT_407213 [Sistotremastrum niveocremeum HHB9708]